MQISKEVAQELVSELDVGHDTLSWSEPDQPYPVNFKVVISKLVDTTRWSHVIERVYEDLDTGKFWQTSYRTGATECQDESPYEYDGDVIELVEVVPVEVTKIIYKVVK